MKTLSVIAGAMPPLPKGEALAKLESATSSPEARPSGELSPQATERVGPLPEGAVTEGD